MPRKPRFFVPGVAAHVVQRGNNHQAIFFERDDYQCYLSLVSEALARYGCAVHAYVLMTNHVHLLLTPEARDSISRMMQYIGRHYVPYINGKYSRSGTLWEGRFKAGLVDTSAYLLACYRYIESNPIRAGMVAHPEDYQWSSYRHNGLGVMDAMITTHVEYESLGATLPERTAQYRLLFDHPQQEEERVVLRAYTQSGTPLGNDGFRDEIETALSMKVGKASRGRPKHADRH